MATINSYPAAALPLTGTEVAILVQNGAVVNTPVSSFMESEGGVRRVLSGSSTSILASDNVVVIDAFPATTFSVFLPAGPENGEHYTIKDRMGAATYNITVTAEGGENIDGAASFVFTENNQAATFEFDETGNEWIVT